MSRAVFDTLVTDLERRYAHRPWALSWRTACVVAIGYAGFVGWVISIAALGVIGFWAAPLVPVGLGPWLILGGSFVSALAFWQCLKVVWIPAEKHQGLRVRAGEYPAVDRLLNEFRIRLKTPRIHV